MTLLASGVPPNTLTLRSDFRSRPEQPTIGPAYLVHRDAMASNKNQHYVPRVHLNPFTLDSEGAAINLFNIARMRAIRDAPVKTQCSGDYFYGRDERLERAINFVENEYGRTVRLLRNGAAVTDEVRTVILRFVYLQYLRTEAASRKAAEMAAAMYDAPGPDSPDLDVRDARTAAVQFAMLHYAESMAIIDDLRVCVARNRTARPFITSDDPAVLTNRLQLQRRLWSQQGFGVRTAGAVFLLPLCPELCAIAYDPAVYRTPQRAGWIDVTDDADADRINEHQVLNCLANLYYRDWDLRGDVDRQVRLTRRLRPERRHTVVYAELDDRSDWGSRYVVRDPADIPEGREVLVHVKANHPAPTGWPSFLRFRPDARAWSNDTGSGLTRRWCLEQGFVTGSGYRAVRV